MATETIGTGETYTTIQSWEDSLGVSLLSEPEIGECKGENFSESPTFSGPSTSATNYMLLRPVSGYEHDGRANAVSGKGNARITVTGNVTIQTSYFRMQFMEVLSSGTSAGDARVRINASAVGVYLDHNIIHNDGGSTNSGNNGILLSDSGCQAYVYRNIIYGMGASGIDISNCTSGTVVYNNTVFDCNTGSNASEGGIRCADSDCTLKNNVAVGNDTADFVISAGTVDYNASSDSSATGTNSVTSVDLGHFRNATTTYASTDLRRGAFNGDVLTDAALYITAVSLSSTFDIDIEGEETVGDWDLGADNFTASDFPVVQGIYQASRPVHVGGSLYSMWADNDGLFSESDSGPIIADPGGFQPPDFVRPRPASFIMSTRSYAMERAPFLGFIHRLIIPLPSGSTPWYYRMVTTRRRKS